MSNDPSADILCALDTMASRLAEKIDGLDGRLSGEVAALRADTAVGFTTVRTEVVGIVREVAAHVDDTERALRAEIGEGWREIAGHVDLTVEA